MRHDGIEQFVVANYLGVPDLMVLFLWSTHVMKRCQEITIHLSNIVPERKLTVHTVPLVVTMFVISLLWFCYIFMRFQSFGYYVFLFQILKIRSILE